MLKSHGYVEKSLSKNPYEVLRCSKKGNKEIASDTVILYKKSTGVISCSEKDVTWVNRFMSFKNKTNTGDRKKYLIEMEAVKYYNRIVSDDVDKVLSGVSDVDVLRELVKLCYYNKTSVE